MTSRTSAEKAGEADAGRGEDFPIKRTGLHIKRERKRKKREEKNSDGNRVTILKVLASKARGKGNMAWVLGSPGPQARRQEFWRTEVRGKIGA